MQAPISTDNSEIWTTLSPARRLDRRPRGAESGPLIGAVSTGWPHCLAVDRDVCWAANPDQRTPDRAALVLELRLPAACAPDISGLPRHCNEPPSA